MKYKIPEGYTALPKDAKQALKELASRFFEPNVTGNSDRKSAPTGYTKATDILNKSDKDELKKHHDETGRSRRIFSAY